MHLYYFYYILNSHAGIALRHAIWPLSGKVGASVRGGPLKYRRRWPIRIAEIGFHVINPREAWFLAQS